MPLALAFLLIAEGDYHDTVLGGVNYGRDADSIASMGGAIAGALSGAKAVPSEWLDPVTEASRIDLVAPGVSIAEVARHVHTIDLATRRAHESAFTSLTWDTSAVEGMTHPSRDTSGRREGSEPGHLGGRREGSEPGHLEDGATDPGRGIAAGERA